MVQEADDIPKSFYPGMWLRKVGNGRTFKEPNVEVVSVGRTSVSLIFAGKSPTVTMPQDTARELYRKVWRSEPPENVPTWVRSGAEFTLSDVGWGPMRLRTIRWGYASVELYANFTQNLIVFMTLEKVCQGTPKLNVWNRLLEDS